jgi:cobalt-zinc-cadmium efflux system membrane fusion protein
MNKKPLLLAPLAVAGLAFAVAVAAPDEHGHEHDHDHQPPATSPATAPTAEPHDHADHGHGGAKSAEVSHAGAHGHDEKHEHPEGDTPGKDPHAPHGSTDAHGHAHDAHDARAHDEHGHGDAEGGHADEVRLTPEAIRRHGITIGRATKQPLAATFVAPARVAFNREAMAHVGSAVQGRAVEVKVRTGDVVKRGDELLVLESPELGQAQSEFLQRRTAVDVAAAKVDPARTAYERARSLHDQSQGIALAEVQKREADLKGAEGELATAKASLAAAENALSLLGMDAAAVEALARTGQVSPRLAIRSPLDGQVIEREVTLGELVSPEEDALLVVADLSELWVLADVPEARLADVAVGAPARVRVAASSDRAIDGKVAYVAPALDPTTRTGRVRVVVPSQDGALRPGMFARVEITTGDHADGGAATLAVPEGAVQTVEGRTAVFVPVEGEPDTFAAKPVTVGRAVGGMVPVASGLREGDAVVTAGTFILKADLAKAGAAHEH